MAVTLRLPSIITPDAILWKAVNANLECLWSLPFENPDGVQYQVLKRLIANAAGNN